MNELALFQNGEQNSFLGLAPRNTEEAKIVYTAMNNPDKKLKDCINQEIFLTNFYMERVTMRDRDDAEKAVQGIRTVLIDAEGCTYQCVSVGVTQSLSRLTSLFGSPDTWESPLVVRVKLINLGQNSMLSLELV